MSAERLAYFAQDVTRALGAAVPRQIAADVSKVVFSLW